MSAEFTKNTRRSLENGVFHRVWKSSWKTVLYMNLFMEKGGKTAKKVDRSSQTVDKCVESVDKFMQIRGCGKPLGFFGSVEKRSFARVENIGIIHKMMVTEE